MRGWRDRMSAAEGGAPCVLHGPRRSARKGKVPMSKVWLLTGSSRGLGLAIAKAVLAARDRLVATARDPGQLQALVDANRDRVRAVALDVTDPAQARAAVDAARSAFGRLDV